MPPSRSAAVILCNLEPILHNISLRRWHAAERADKTTGEWRIIAANDIETGEELTVDYTHTPDFISKPDPNWRCPIL